MHRQNFFNNFLFHLQEEKAHKSKWTRSDDFEAEFFDRHHRELTENLISRRSPLIFNSPLLSPSSPSLFTQKQNPLPDEISKRTSILYAQQMSAPSGDGRSYGQHLSAADLRGDHHHKRESARVVLRRQPSHHQPTTTTNTSADGDSASAAGNFDCTSSFSATNDTSGPNTRQRRARPRSACLDTYLNSNMLRFVGLLFFS